MKTTELENVCQLFGSDDKTNHQLALQVLKGQPDLTEEVKAFFQPILEASKKKTVSSIPSILEQLKKGKGTMKARLQLGTLPFLHPYIENLALNDERLEEVPHWIRNLKNLKSLALSGCELTECPNWIGELTNLTFISFASNQLTSIPESVGALVDLEYAYFSENELSEIPESLSNLKSLKFIYIKKGNSLSKAEKEKVDGLFKHTKVF